MRTPLTEIGNPGYLSQSIMQVDFVDPTTGWVTAMTAEGQGQLFKTTDGGTTWSSLIQ